MYPVHEIFYSIQGEGQFAGTASIFIRLAGCNVGCPWCDTKETWRVSEQTERLSATAIVQQLNAFETKHIVLTGGEPTLYNLTNLCQELHAAGYFVSLETSGTNEILGEFDWVCLSPKPHFPPVQQALDKTSSLKVVIEKTADFKFAEQMRALTPKTSKAFLQVEWNSKATINQEVIAYVKKHPNWRLSVQTHKVLSIR